MTTRIAALAEQALDYTEEQSNSIDVNSITVEEGSAWWDKTCQEKFAELIIEECILQVKKDHYGSGESWDKSLDNAVRNIKQHFEV